jgi:hypothetical protein
VPFSAGTNVPVGGLSAALQLRSQSYRSRLRKAPRLTCARSGNARFPPCMSRSALDCVEFTEWESYSEIEAMLRPAGNWALVARQCRPDHAGGVPF